MTGIFLVSSDLGSGAHTSRFILPFLHWLFPQATPEFLQHAHHLIRKAGHVTEYAILALLVRRAMRRTCLDWSERRILAVALLNCAAYAVTDEFHQSFVPSRGASPVDVLIDTGGAASALLLAWLWTRRPQRPSKSEK
jgi:VanZ family protein